MEGIVAGYPGRPVLRGVSLAAPAGRITGLIGPNGSGKTTIVRVASRGLRPESGAVRVDGVDPYQLPVRQAARLTAVVPQDLAVLFAYSVEEMVLMGRSPYLRAWGGGGPEDWRLAREAMAAAGVEELADRAVDRLSGGERQRVVLAQALAQDTPVLLLDEPTTHLDLRFAIEFLDRVRALARDRGRAILAVFHDLNLTARYCDSVYAMADGQVIAVGRPAEVLTPSTLRTVFGVEVQVLHTADGTPVVAPPDPRVTGREGTRTAKLGAS
jgi:iron complex transport system ATP-binding protein